MDDRVLRIYKLLLQRHTMTVEELCIEMRYSRSTIRRDLLRLETMGAIKRVNGNIQILVSSGKEKHRELRNNENVEAKEKIATLTKSRYIQDGMSLFLDSSTTVQRICPLLAQYKNITVITNGLDTAKSITEMKNIELFLTGGYWRHDTCSILGETAVEYVKQFQLDVCLLSCSGIDEKGIYEASSQESYVKQAMMKHSNSTIVLCDKTKFDSKFKFRLASFCKIEAVITDSPPSEFIQEALKTSECRLIY